ncbi:MmgE/PrpD family protein [Advenella mimigardefordensis]|nr:MmgE/PrpD family protein [Advenella mimigardefordensis]
MTSVLTHENPKSSAIAENDQADFSSVLADFICNLDPQSLPLPVRQAAQANIQDTLTCAVAGSSAQGVAQVRELVSEWGGAPQASVLVFGDRIPAHHAAWINGMMAHARDYDDTHDAAVLHAGVSVVPAALAAAQLRGGVSGAQLIAGVAVGLETICRLGTATTVGIVESGFMYTPLFGHFAATAAAAKILGLNRNQIINALGISYSQVAGNHQVTRDAALTKRMQPGFAAMAGIVSVQLAQKGIRGVQATFEGIDGFFRVYLQNRYDPDLLRNSLGERYIFTDLSYKPYPCCRFNHCGIEAALELREQLGERVADIVRIRAGLNRQAYQAVCTPIDVRRSPQTVVQAQFSIPYTVATALVDGYVGLAHFGSDLHSRQDIIDLAQKVEPYVDDEIERSHGRNVSPVDLEIEFADGSTLRRRIDTPLGHPDRPMSAGAVATKANDCFKSSACSLAVHAPQALSEMVGSLDSVADIEDLLRIVMQTS